MTASKWTQLAMSSIGLANRKPALQAVALDADGETYAVGTASEVILGSTRLGMTEHVIAIGTAVNALAFSPDGGLVAAATNAGLWIGDVHGLEPRPVTPIVEPMQAVSWAPNGATVAVAGRRSVIHLVDLGPNSTSPRKIRAGIDPRSKWSRGEHSLAWSPDGTRIAAAFSQLLLVDVTAGAMQCWWHAVNTVDRSSFSEPAIGGIDHGPTWVAEPALAHSVAWLLGGARLASTGVGYGDGRAWDVSGAEPRLVEPAFPGAPHLVAAADGRRIVGNKEWQAWTADLDARGTVTSGRHLEYGTMKAHDVAISADGRRIAVALGEGGLAIFDAGART